MKFRANRADGRNTYFTTIDSEIPLVDGVTVVCGRAESAEVLVAASRAGLRASERRWADGRAAVVIGAR